MLEKLKLLKVHKFYAFAFVFSLMISNLLGYKFKKLTDFFILRDALRKDTKWEYDAYLDMIYSDYSFFHLNTVYANGRTVEVFSYNWEVFTTSLFLLMGLAIFIGETIYFDKLNQFFKNIKRVDKD